MGGGVRRTSARTLGHAAALLLGALASALPAIAQTDRSVAAERVGGGAPPAELPPPGSDGPEALTALALAVCIFPSTEPEIDEDVLSVVGLRLVEREDETVSYETEDAALRLTVGSRPDYAGCEMTLRDVPDGFPDLMAETLGAALAETFAVADLETLEDGQLWRIQPSEGLRLRVALRREGQDLLLTSATGVNAVMENSE